MKIKDIIRTLIESGEDFSDHGDGRIRPGPGHAANCAFCDAWREAQWVIGPECPKLLDFEAGEPVWLPGQVRGRVMGTDILVRIEVQNGEHGPWAVGMFSPLHLTPRDTSTSEFTWWRDKDGDIWERRESDSLMRLYAWGPDSASNGKLETPDDWTQVEDRFSHVEKRYGGPAGLVQIEKP